MEITSFIWLFPVLFVFHDLEEIIGFGIWGEKNISIIEKRMPKIGATVKKMYEPYSTEGMALAVFEELVLCIGICIFSILTGRYQLWLGVFIAFIIHLLMHIVQATVYKGYIPAVVTSVIALPVSVFVLYRSEKLLKYSVGSIILYSAIGIFIMLINIKFAHYLLHWFTNKMKKNT